MSRWQLFRNATQNRCFAGSAFWPKAAAPADECRGSFWERRDASGPPSHSSEYLREESGIGIPPSTTRRITISTTLQLLL